MKGEGEGKGKTSYNHKNSFRESKHGGNKPSPSSPKLLLLLILLLPFIYFLYLLSLIFSSPSCPLSIHSKSNLTTTTTSISPPPRSNATTLNHIVFGIAASSKLWLIRRTYIQTWWRPSEMRGYIWLDKPVQNHHNLQGLPKLKISSDTSSFRYTHKTGGRSAIRISRIVSETVRMALPDVRWFVMGDDDTVFLPDNLLNLLNGFDHTQPYYIGSSSESHLQNIYFSYAMAYGGGGFAISRPLAEALSRIQDGCLNRYPALYGSDDRIQACMAELGVPLTKHRGFHQFDVYGDLLGLLAAHPVTPLISLHHLDVVEPIFPGMSRAESVRKLFDGPVKLDSAGVMQQSICYARRHKWTVSVSWGFVVQVVRGVMSPREMEMPARTFLNWYRRADYTAYAFNTRPVARNPCQKPYIYYLASASYDEEIESTVTVYNIFEGKHPPCKWKMADPAEFVDRIVVYKKPDPGIWDRSPRRNCCNVMEASSEEGNKTMSIHVGACKEGEIIHK